MSRIATGGGDAGETSLFGGQRVSKADHPAVEAYGAVDELNAVLGLVHAVAGDERQAWVEELQGELFAIGAELATPGGGTTRIPQASVARLEEELDDLEEQQPALQGFVLPSGNELAARLHHARTVCRRAERRIVALHGSQDGPVRETVRVYVNRLSDLLFLRAREAALADDAEVSMSFDRFQQDD